MLGLTSHGTGFDLIFADVSSRYEFESRDSDMVVDGAVVPWSGLSYATGSE